MLCLNLSLEDFCQRVFPFSATLEQMGISDEMQRRL